MAYSARCVSLVCQASMARSIAYAAREKIWILWQPAASETLTGMLTSCIESRMNHLHTLSCALCISLQSRAHMGMNQYALARIMRGTTVCSVPILLLSDAVLCRLPWIATQASGRGERVQQLQL